MGTRLTIGFFLTFPLFIGCTDDELLIPVCPDTCYTGPERTLNVGECKPGVPICDEEGEIIECVGEVKPRFEICDSQRKDYDCDGEHNDTNPLFPTNPRNTCPQCGKCSGTYMFCEDDGQFHCRWPDGAPSQEVCDGTFTDEDCDCQVDEAEDLFPDQEIVFCYGGPVETVNVGACRPGIMSCSPETGELVCSDVQPTEETCNEVDDDCNGFIDDVQQEYESLAIVMGVDTSGSMMSLINSVKAVICLHAQASSGGSSAYRFALVEISNPDYGYQVALDFSSASDLCAALNVLPDGGGAEPTLSAAADVVNPDNPLELTWPENARRVFIGFTDEEAQVLIGLYPTAVLEESIEDCQESDTAIYWFSNEDDFFEEQAEACDGRHFIISPNEDHMLLDLNSIVSSECFDPLL